LSKGWVRVGAGGGGPPAPTFLGVLGILEVALQAIRLKSVRKLRYFRTAIETGAQVFALGSENLGNGSERICWPAQWQGKIFEIKDFLAATGQGGQREAGVVIGVLPLFWSLSWPRPSTPTPFR
jgi:hypothetical protein